MVFQRPNLFPTLSIFDNVVSGLRMNGVKKKDFLLEAAEAALRQAALWDSVKYRLRSPAVSLSGANNNASASHGPSRSSPRSCCSMSRAQHWTAGFRPH